MGGVTCYVPPTRVALSMSDQGRHRNPPGGSWGEGPGVESPRGVTRRRLHQPLGETGLGEKG